MTLILVVLVRLVGAFDFFQTFMQFLMSSTTFGDFVAVDGWRHASTPECNAVQNYEGYDDIIAVMASCQAWIILVPIVYEISKILVPGVPKSMQASMEANIKAVAADAEKKPDKKAHFNIMHTLKYGSVTSPDLWISFLASKWVRAVYSATPLTTTRNEEGCLNEHTDHEVKYISYKVKDKYAVSVRSTHSYDALEIAEVTANQLVETCSDLLQEEVVATSGRTVMWMQLISHSDGWVPTCTPTGEPLFELVDKQLLEMPASHPALPKPQSPAANDDDVVISPLASDIELDDMEEGTGASSRKKHASMKYNGTEANMLRIDSQTLKNNPSFRVVSTGEKSNADMQCGLYFALPGYSNKVWSSYNSFHVAESAFHLCIIDRASGEVDFAFAYDVIGDGQTTEGRRLRHLVHDLNRADDSKIVVLFTTGTPGTSHRKFGGLGEALDRCGGSGQFYETSIEEDCAYVLIGIAGKGKGTGYEVIQGDGKAANIDLNFEVTSDGFHIHHVEKGVFDSSRCFSNKNYIFAVYQERTSEENDKWRALQMKSTPSYLTLCRLERKEMCTWFEARPLCQRLVSPLTLMLSICGLGHLMTNIGRKAWYCVIWKIGRFFLLCLGYWTDDIVEAYEIHQHVHEMSVVWDKPFKRKSKEAYMAYKIKISGIEEETLKKTGKPKKWFKDYFCSLPAFMTPEGGWIEDTSTREETEEMMTAQQVDLKRKLRANYAATLHAVVAIRAVLLQAFPKLSFVSIYSATMSSTPIMVHSKRLANNLPELIISEPFVETRTQEQESIDEQEWIRRANLTEHQNCVPNPEYRTVGGKLVKVPDKEREKIAEGNEANREDMKSIINFPSRTVDEWIVAINGTTLFMTESRGFNFLINLYKFILTVGILWTKPDKLKYWMMSSAIILFPYCLLIALGFLGVIGKTFYITDGDIEQALGSVGMGHLFQWVLRYTASSKALRVDNSPCIGEKSARGGDIELTDMAVIDFIPQRTDTDFRDSVALESVKENTARPTLQTKKSAISKDMTMPSV